MIARTRPRAGIEGPPAAETAGHKGRVRFWQAVREFLYGMTGYEFAQQSLEARGSLETLFLLVVFGDAIGLPIMPPYYSLRLLPLALPRIPGWKRHVLRPHELGDNHEHHLHGV